MAKNILVNRDRLFNANKADVAKGCVKLFDRIQGWPVEEQLMCLAAAFSLVCDEADISPLEVYNAFRLLMRDPMSACGIDVRFDAMKYHLRTEVYA